MDNTIELKIFSQGLVIDSLVESNEMNTIIYLTVINPINYPLLARNKLASI